MFFEQTALFWFLVYFFFIKKVNSPPASAVDSSSLPVCLAKAAKSLTEPGSVDRIFSTCPLVTSPRAFLARRIGRGQFRPRASSSLSKFIQVLLTLNRHV